MNTKTLQLVTWGRYKGQPTASLLKDLPYTKWCIRQSFVKRLYPALYDSCVSHTSPPTTVAVDEIALLHERLVRAEDQIMKLQREVKSLTPKRRTIPDYFGKEAC